VLVNQRGHATPVAHTQPLLLPIGEGDLRSGTARHYSEIVAEQIASGAFQFPANTMPQTTVTWHDSCHIGRVSGVYEPPRDMYDQGHPQRDLCGDGS